MAEFIDGEASVEQGSGTENAAGANQPARARRRRNGGRRASCAGDEAGHGKFWCWTLNNPAGDELERLRAFARSDVVRYAIWQREVGEAGTEHLQGYFELRRRRAFGTLHRMFRRLHLEERKGTRDEAREYCRKHDGTQVPDTVEEFGEWKAGGQGARTDLSSVTQALQAGSSVCDTIVQYPLVFARYPRFMAGYKAALGAVTKRAWLTKVVVFIGPTGTGKTRLAHHLWPELFVKSVASDRSLWMDGYEGHRAVLIDDFHGPEIPLPTLLRLLDRHPVDVPVKGGHVNFAPHVVVITSNVELGNWYPTANLDHVAALRRRVTLLVQFPITAEQLAELERLSQYGRPGGDPLERNV